MHPQNNVSILTELTEEELATVAGGEVNGCTIAGGLAASATGFALAAAGIATAGWGALAGVAVYAACSIEGGDSLGQISDIIGA